MLNLKAILRKDKCNKMGLAPIYLRMTKDSVVTYLTLDLKVLTSNWNYALGQVKNGDRCYTQILMLKK